jgi:hypothetical protein
VAGAGGESAAAKLEEEAKGALDALRPIDGRGSQVVDVGWRLPLKWTVTEPQRLDTDAVKRRVREDGREAADEGRQADGQARVRAGRRAQGRVVSRRTLGELLILAGCLILLALPVAFGLLTTGGR